jgi:hypothetical protein
VPINRPVVVWDHPGADIRTTAANKMDPVCLMFPLDPKHAPASDFFGFLLEYAMTKHILQIFLRPIRSFSDMMSIS